MNKLYIQHKLTAYHLRDRWRGNRVGRLAICHCGAAVGVFGKIRRRTIRRSLLLCSWRGHDWDEATPVEIGDIVEDEDGHYHSTCDDLDIDTVVGYMRQCQRCYKCEDL